MFMECCPKSCVRQYTLLLRAEQLLLLQTNALAAGTALLQVAPHIAGAIDVVVVRQPDGSLKSSPFYGERGLNSSIWVLATHCELLPGCSCSGKLKAETESGPY